MYTPRIYYAIAPSSRCVQLLQPLGREERQQVIECLRPRVYRPGEPIIREGDEGHDFFLLIEGHAQVSKERPSGVDSMRFKLYGFLYS